MPSQPLVSPGFNHDRHIAALRSVSKLARTLGLITWFLEAPGVKAERRRDTRGPNQQVGIRC
jgi:hypothetical protein